MKKVLIWIVSKDFRFFDRAIDILELQQGGLEFVGVTAASADQIIKLDKNIPFISLNEVTARGGGEYDVLLVVGAKEQGMTRFVQTARSLKLPEEKLLGDWIVCIPGFTLEKYRELERSCLSIFSMNCFGGRLSHFLGLQFYTPFINMFLLEQDYIRLLRSPRTYMDENLILKKTSWNDVLKIDYPIFTLGDVELYMNHYHDFEEAKNAWNRRKNRINWSNLFITCYTEREEILHQFDELPYDKKACFIPFKSDKDSAWHINVNLSENRALWQYVMGFARGDVLYYDLFDMLLNGKKTPLIEDSPSPAGSL